MTFQLASTLELGIGKQTAIGTLAAATRKINFNTAPFNWDLRRRRFAGSRGRANVSNTAYRPKTVMNRATVPVAGDLDFSDILLPLLSGVDNDPTIEKPGSTTDVQLLKFDNTGEETPPIDYFTFWRRGADGAATPNQAIHRAGKGFCTNMAFSEGGEGSTQLTSTYQLGAMESQSAIAGADPGEYLLGETYRSKFSLYNSWNDAIAETNPVSGTDDVLGIGAGYATGRVAVTRRDRAIDYAKVRGGGRSMTMSARAYVDFHSTGLLVSNEVAKVAANNFRFARIDYESASEIEAGHPYRLSLVMCCTHDNGSLTVREDGEQDGFSTMNIALSSAKDPTSGNDVYFEAQLHTDLLTAYGLTPAT